MTNLIIDLSNLAFRSLFVTSGYGSKNYYFDNQYEIDQFLRKMATDISFIIRQTNTSRIIFALDSKSWRKEISIDENEGYKANRIKGGIINWDNVFNTISEFADILNSNGFIVSKIDNAEADDIITMWRDELFFKQHQHLILVSADEDIRQLVCYYPYDINKKVFTTVFNPDARGKNPTKKLYVPKYFNEWINTLSEGDIFDRSIDVDKEDFIRLKDSEKVTIEETDGNLIALKKIFCGDDGDNVPSIFSWLDKNGKVARITNSKFNKIIDSIGAKDYLDLMGKSKEIYDQIVNISGKRPPFKMEERLKRQIKLVVLSRDVFPKQIVKDFDDKIQECLNKPNINSQNWNMNSILEGTKYIRKNYNESSIFREIDNKLF